MMHLIAIANKSIEFSSQCGKQTQKKEEKLNDAKNILCWQIKSDSFKTNKQLFFMISR